MSDSFKKITVTSHTGCEKTKDNSIESVDKAIESGADIFEVDVSFDKNGKPVLSHDAPKGNEPSLEEVFKKLSKQKKIKCNLDIKFTDNLKEIVFLAKEYSVLDKIFYTGIKDEFVESAKTETPEISYYLNVNLIPKKKQTKEYLDSLVGKVRESEAIGINCNYKNVTPELVEVFHQNNLLVSLWTVNSRFKMLKVIKMKPDNITTRKPVLLRKLLSK